MMKTPYLRKASLSKKVHLLVTPEFSARYNNVNDIKTISLVVEVHIPVMPSP